VVLIKPFVQLLVVCLTLHSCYCAS